MIHLVNMPCASLIRPSLALGVMKAQLAQAGLPARVHNLNLHFAQRIGFGSYESIATYKGVETQVSEWLFAGAAWDEEFGPSEEEFCEMFRAEIGDVPKVPDTRAWLLKIRREVVPAFLDECAQRIALAGPVDVVAFSCTFFQTIPSLALGRRLKQRFPDVRVAYGGASFHGEMGEELCVNVPWMDAVSVGEADDVVVPLFRALSEGCEPEGLTGIRWRDAGGELRSGPDPQPVDAGVLEALPDPDYDEFVEDTAAVGLLHDPVWRERALIPFEGSRGCWWGERRHCTFCGLNAQDLGYRTRSPERLHAMLSGLAERYPFRKFQASDNILPARAFDDLVPMLADQPPAEGVEIFWSVKTNMTRAQVAALAAAGIRYCQPGIESLNDHLLELMRKGVSALQNVFFLRVCREYDVLPYWNLLIRVPGERREDYEQTAAWLPKLAHLRPPSGGAPRLECHRFSPYFFEEDRWVESKSPRPWYRGLFPEDRFDLSRVAYYFDATWKDTLPPDVHDRVLEQVLEWHRVWREAPELPKLTWEERPDGSVAIVDTRGGAARRVELGPFEAAVHAAIDAPAGLRKVQRHLAGTAFEGEPEERVRATLDRLAAEDVALTDGRQWVALALPAALPDPSPELRRGRLQRVPNQRPQAARV